MKITAKDCGTENANGRAIQARRSAGSCGSSVKRHHKAERPRIHWHHMAICYVIFVFHLVDGFVPLSSIHERSSRFAHLPSRKRHYSTRAIKQNPRPALKRVSNSWNFCVSTAQEDTPSPVLSSPPAKISKIDRETQIQNVKQSFVAKIEESIQSGTFVSLVLQGPAKKNKKKATKKDLKAAAASTILDNEDLMRGCIKQIQGRRIQLQKGKQQQQQHYLQMTFKYHSATDIVKNWPLTTEDSGNDLREAFMAILDSQGVDNLGNSMDKYVPASEWGKQEMIVDGSSANQQLIKLVLGIQRGALITSSHTIDLDVAYNSKMPKVKLTERKDSDREDSSDAPVAIANHDRVKKVPLDSKASFLQALGVTDTKGKPKRAMSSKLRQCQKFVEIVGNLVDRVAVSGKKDTIIPRVMDMGCGRGYLTFSLHSYLYSKFEKVQSVGIDMRPKLVKEMNDIAQTLGTTFEGVSFEKGSIEELVLVNSSGTEFQKYTAANSSGNGGSPHLDILIALHACDTATDDALWCGISRQADVIVVAPCCHKQVRSQLNAHLSGSTKEGGGDSHPLADMLRHNVYRERQAEMVTDSIRALLLEVAGYQVQVFEFVGGEHTAKNVMITAIRSSSKQHLGGKGQVLDEKQQRALLSRLEELASLHGIKRQKLAQWMGSSFLGESSPLFVDILNQRQFTTSDSSRLSPGSMPPI